MLLPVLAVVCLLALSACMKIDVNLTVSGDDTVNGSMVLAVDKQLLAQLGQSADAFFTQLGRPAPQPARGGQVSDYDEGRYVGHKITFTDVSIGDFDRQMVGGETVGSPDSAGGGKDLRIVHDRQARTYTVGGSVDFSALGGTDPMLARFRDSLDVRIAI